MPADFNFSYSFDYTEELNTFDSTYKRHYNFHDSIFKLTLTADEKNRIYLAMMENEVLEMPDYFEPDTTKGWVDPHRIDYLTIQINNTKKKITYTYCCQPKDKRRADKYLKIIKTIQDILNTKTEIQQLPDSDFFVL